MTWSRVVATVLCEDEMTECGCSRFVSLSTVKWSCRQRLRSIYEDFNWNAALGTNGADEKYPCDNIRKSECHFEI